MAVVVSQHCLKAGESLCLPSIIGKIRPRPADAASRRPRACGLCCQKMLEIIHVHTGQAGVHML